MSKLDKHLGFDINIVETADPVRLDALKSQVIGRLSALDIGSFAIYLCAFEIKINRKSIKTFTFEQRIDGLRVALRINPKQRRESRMRFVNHHTDLDRDCEALGVTVIHKPHQLIHKIPVSAIARNLRYDCYAAIAISRAVRDADRKITLAVSPVISNEFKATSERDFGSSTKANLRISRFVQLEIRCETALAHLEDASTEFHELITKSIPGDGSNSPPTPSTQQLPTSSIEPKIEQIIFSFQKKLEKEFDVVLHLWRTERESPDELVNAKQAAQLEEIRLRIHSDLDRLLSALDEPTREKVKPMFRWVQVLDKVMDKV